MAARFNILKTGLLLLTLYIIQGCGGSTSSTTAAAVDTEVLVTKLFISTGTETANTVFINTQGGPLNTFLSAEEVHETFSSINLTTSLLVNVQQEHLLNIANYNTATLTFEQAKEINVKSTAILKRVIDHFKNQGKTIHVIGSSYGAIMVIDSLATHGNIADKYSVSVGRLDMDEDVWMRFSNGIPVIFNYTSDTYTVSTATNSQAGMSGGAYINKIAAGVAYKRFTTLLADIDLSNLHYAYGTKDEQVGTLSSAEVAFLKSKNATVIAVQNGNHEQAGQAINPALNRN